MKRVTAVVRATDPGMPTNPYGDGPGDADWLGPFDACPACRDRLVGRLKAAIEAARSAPHAAPMP